jgi:hypothetical protein
MPVAFYSKNEERTIPHCSIKNRENLMESREKITFWGKYLLSLNFLAILFSNIAYCATYYVNNSGSPACSNSAGFGTLGKPYCTITYTISRISVGDTIYVRSGTYNEELYITNLTGSAGANTIIAVYPGDTVTLRGNGGDRGGRIKIANTSYLTFDGFKITEWNQGLFVENSSNITLQNLEVYSVGQEAVRIRQNSSYVILQNSLIHDTRTWQYNGEGVYVGTRDDAEPNDNTNHVTIKNNTIYNTNDECVELKPGTHDCIVEGNNISHCNQDPAYSSTLDLGSIEVDEAVHAPQHWDSNPNHIIRNNVIHDTRTAIMLGTGSTAYNNVIYNIDSLFRGIQSKNLADDSYKRTIYHNTIDVASSRALVSSGGITDVRNNIGPTSTYNIATADSFYVNKAGANYRLNAGSAPINVGVDLTAIVPTDFEGKLRTLPPDLGAYEYSDTNTLLPPQNLRVINQH